MAYIAPLHHASGVRTALKLNFLDIKEESLIVASVKSNRLEIYQISTDGITLHTTKTVYGTITLLSKLRPPDSQLDQLLVGTDRYAYFVLSWDASKSQLVTIKPYVDLADKLARPSSSVDRCVVDPTGRVLVLEVFEGTLTVLPLFSKTKGKNAKEEWMLGDPIPLRVPERFIRSLCFLHNREVKVSKQTPKPRLAILYDDGAGDCRRIIQTLDCTNTLNEPGDASFTKEGSKKTAKGEVEYTASHLIPIEQPIFGLITLSEVSITYCDHDGATITTYTLSDPTIWSSWAQIDANRWLLADDYGQAYVLGLDLEDQGFAQPNVKGLRLERIGKTSRASVLVYLDAGCFYVGSKAGDSQVIRIDDHGTIDIVETLPGIAPITDFTIMDMGNRSGEGQVNEYSSGQARIVTGSGAFEDGSLRSVRSGVGITELGILDDVRHATNLFPLRASHTSSAYDTLVISFVNETKVFGFSNDEVEDKVSFQGFVLNEATLLAQNLPNNKLLQVTASGARLADLEDGVVGDYYDASESPIRAASADDNHLVLSLNGYTLVTLDLKDSLKIISKRTFNDGLQVSCLDVSRLAPEIVIVGFWQNNRIAILSRASLDTIYQQEIGSEDLDVPRSLLLAQLLPHHLPTLLAAMADGSIVSLDMDTRNYQMSNVKSTVLATQQAKLQLLPRENDIDQVFAACEHSSLIYGSEGRLIYSAVTVSNAACVCSFDSEAYPGALAIAGKDDIKIALIDHERRTHVETLPVGETVRRIAYSPSLRAFGLGCIQRTLSDGIELIQSSFKLVDEVVFEPQDTYLLESEEIIESVIRAELRSANGQLEERFVVGTAYIEDGTGESIRGRILLFEVSRDRKLVRLAEQKVKSACRVLAAVEGKLVAALMKTLVIYSVEHDIFSKLATIRTATAPIDLCVSGNTIGIGDLMKSLSIVRFTEGEAGENGKITEIARHFQTAWTTAIAEIEKHTYLEADAEGNLVVLQQNINGVSQDDKRRLEVISEFRLGEMVNKIRTVQVTTSTASAVVPRAFVATVEGSLYLFGTIRDDKQNLLMKLQSNMAKYVTTPGLIPFHKYRAYHSLVRDTDEPFRFVDGELIESFLSCDDEMQKKMIEGLETNIEDMRIMIENLRRMH